jgi:hypothetical protein
MNRSSDVGAEFRLLRLYTRPDGPFQWIATLAEEGEAHDRKLRDFLRYFQCQLFELHGWLRASKPQLGSTALGAFITDILALLESLVVNNGTPSLPHLSLPYPNLWALENYHASIHSSTGHARAEKLDIYIDFNDVGVRKDILQLMEDCAEVLCNAGGKGDTIDSTPTKIKRAQPNYDIRKWSDDFFRVFWATCRCEQCSAPTTTLALATHRKSLDYLDLEAILSLSDSMNLQQEVKFKITAVE